MFASAESFLQSVQRGNTGCLVLDLRMPGIDGFETIRNHAETGLKPGRNHPKPNTETHSRNRRNRGYVVHPDSVSLGATNEDKRRAVMTLLADEEWGKWSDNEIARRCEVSDFGSF